MARPTSRKKIARQSEQKYVGWQWDGNDSQALVLQRINMVLGILKAALVQPLGRAGEDPIFGDFVMGDYMRQQRQANEDRDDAWADYIRSKQDPPGWAETPNTPNPRIQDVSREREESDRRR